MKSITLTIAIFVLTVFTANAQKETKIGGFLAYGTEIENIGIGTNAEFPIADKLTISPSFIYYLPKDAGLATLNWFELNANANYYFINDEKISVYGIGGLNYSNVKVNFEENSIFSEELSASDSRIGLNLGGGANFDIGSDIEPFAELKYVIIDGGQLVLAAGIKYKL